MNHLQYNRGNINSWSTAKTCTDFHNNLWTTNLKTPVASGGEYKSHYELQIRDVVHAEGMYITESDIQGYVFPGKRIIYHSQ